MKPEPVFPKWLLDQLLESENTVPGITAETLSSGPSRIQTVAALIALTGTENEILCSPAVWSREQRQGLLLRNIPGMHPAYPSLVANPKFGILPQQFYAELASWLNSRRPSPRTLSALRHGQRLNAVVLAQLDTLDLVAHRPALLDCLPDKASAAELQSQIDLVRSLIPSITDHDLETALKHLTVRTKSTIHAAMNQERYRGPPSSIVASLLKRARFPEPPLKSHPNLRPLKSVSCLEKAGNQLKNCAGSLADMVLLEDSYFYAWSADGALEPQAIVQLKRAGRFWRIERYEGPRHTDFSERYATQLVRDFRDAGAMRWPLSPLYFLDHLDWHDSSSKMHGPEA